MLLKDLKTLSCVGYNDEKIYYSNVLVEVFMVPAGETKINLFIILISLIANSAATNPPNEDPAILALFTPTLFRKSFRNFTKYGILYSTVGLSLYPKPIISGTIVLKCSWKKGMTLDHLSADAPIPCNKTNVSSSVELKLLYSR